jgi:beta-xylosidase
MSFDDAYPGGRVPMLAPMHFDEDGWPALNSDKDFSGRYRYPSNPVPLPGPGVTGTDTFEGSLNPQWEWNHNPDEDAYSFAPKGGLILNTATVTKDIFHAKNTLTKRILGPSSSGTVELDISNMNPGDRAGLALFRDNLAYISYQDGEISLWRNLSLGAGWETISDGFVEDSVSVKANRKCLWFKLHANIAPESDKLGTFYYSTNGHDFKQLGTPYEMNTTYYFFIGYRYGIFNFATEELGGSVKVKSFTQEQD